MAAATIPFINEHDRERLPIAAAAGAPGYRRPASRGLDSGTDCDGYDRPGLGRLS
jgi:hypothetical protein